MKRDKKIRSEADTDRSIRSAKKRLLIQQAEMAELNHDFQLASLYFKSASDLAKTPKSV